MTWPAAAVSLAAGAGGDGFELVGQGREAFALILQPLDRGGAGPARSGDGFEQLLGFIGQFLAQLLKLCAGLSNT